MSEEQEKQRICAASRFNRELGIRKMQKATELLGDARSLLGNAELKLSRSERCRTAGDYILKTIRLVEDLGEFVEDEDDE